MAAKNPQQEDSISYRAISSQCIDRFKQYHDEGEAACDSFLPRDRMRSLTERHKVESTLNDQLDKPQDVLELTEYVVGNAKKVFLTLICSNAIQHIRGLQRARFTDDDLPVFGKKFPDGHGVSIHRWCVNDTSTYVEEQVLLCFLGWPESQLEDFLRKQWVFLAPVFAQDKFEHVLYSLSPLPYVSTPNPEQYFGDSHFGMIMKVGLQNGHHEYRSLFEDQETEGCIEVSVKKLTIQGSDVADVEKFYTRERVTLEKMRDLNHRHLIKAIAAYRKGTDRCFVFPWARGGSLRDLWKTDISLDEGLVSWAIEQMAGLSDGLRKLHDTETRHGDLKPDNILCFISGNGSPQQRTLVLADIGLGKYDKLYTASRNRATTMRHASRIYEPPEMFMYNSISPKYDTWSLGCVFLEFTIWLLYGRDGLASFSRTLVKNSYENKFWIIHDEKGPGLNPGARERIDKILTEDLKDVSALRDVVELIVKRLLVPERKYRTTTKDLCAELNTVLRKCSNSRRYLFNSELEDLAKRRSKPDIIPGGDMPQPSGQYPGTSLLHEKWQNVTDNESARTIIARLGWPSLRPKTDTSRVCDACVALDFQLPTLELNRSIEELSSGSDRCSLCHFLFRCLSKVKPKPEEPVKLSRDNASHTLQVHPSATPVISMYSDPVSGDNTPSYGQLGLPILPESASQLQFKLLNKWIHLCDSTHNCTSVQDSKGHPDSMPTRVIHVGTCESPCLRLVETGGSVREKYIALSHCWGKLSKEQKFVTSAGNLDDRKKEIPLDEMPKSFQDAVRVTRALGIAYLWIDSLCIIQEDEEDWEAESAKMEDVFSSAYCTIAASSARSSLDGFLGDRTQRGCVTIYTPQGPVLYLAEAIDDFQAHVERSVLNSRGWVLQERALSRRTIHFTSTQVYWECGQGIHCETLAQLRNPQSQFLGHSNFPSLGLQYYKDEQTRLLQHLYRVYSSLQLTNATDRSRAILGLQKRLSRTFKSRADYGVLWGFEGTILWQAKATNTLSRIPYGEGRAVPSWSWMACTGEIQYMDIPSDVNWMENPTNRSDNIPEGVEWDGQLTAEASQLLIDGDELLGRAVIDCSAFTFDSAVWRCVVVGKSKVENESGDVDHYVLLIRPLGGPAQVYERVGAGILLGKHISTETTRVHLG